MSIASTLAIGKNVELDLPYTRIQLLVKRLMAIFKRWEDLRILLHHEPGFARRQPSVIAVVRADHLNLIDFYLIIRPLLPPGEGSNSKRENSDPHASRTLHSHQYHLQQITKRQSEAPTALHAKDRHSPRCKFRSWRRRSPWCRDTGSWWSSTR